MFDDVENLGRLFQRSVLGFFRYDEIYIDIGVDEITVGRSPDSAFDSHQAMFLGMN